MVSAALVANLPDPDTTTGTDVVIWDGQCIFCRQQVLRLRSLDWTGRLSFLSLHDARCSQRYPDLSFEQLIEQMWVVTTTGKRFGGADAIRYLSRKLPLLWPIAPAMHFPFAMPLWRSMYAWVAKRRYRFAGRDCDGGTCHLHVPRPKQ